MTAGVQYTAETINSNAAAAVIGVRNAFSALMIQYDWLSKLGAAGIEDAPAVGSGTQISSADASTILSALTDLAGLCQFFSGEAVTLGYGAAKVTGTYDFMSFGNLLTNGS